MSLFGQKLNRVRKRGTKPRKSDKAKLTDTDSTQLLVSDPPPQLTFHVQEAQGSATATVSNFTNVQELYTQIGTALDFPPSDILFCTLNTHRIDIEKLLSSQLSLHDFIFVHRRGLKKEVELVKSEAALGLTITDNGVGIAFIKRIRKGSLIDTMPVIQVGDHIESINGVLLVGKRHLEVAQMLKDIPLGDTFVMRLIEPLRSGFVNVGAKSDHQLKKTVGSGRETLRFRAAGPAKLELAPDDQTMLGVSKVNDLLDSFLGISDLDLAREIWDKASGAQNTMEFAEELDNSDLDSFGFTDDFVIEVWGIVTDVKDGRLKGTNLEAKLTQLKI